MANNVEQVKQFVERVTEENVKDAPEGAFKEMTLDEAVNILKKNIKK